jgi:hypothetical protein
VKISWLWFLMGLFLNCMVLYPLLAWTQRRYAKKAFDRSDFALIVGQGIALGLIGYLGYTLSGSTMGLAQYVPSLMVIATYFTV